MDRFRKCRYLTKMVEVDPVVKDFWGIPVVRISGLRHDNDIKVGHFLADKAEEWLKEAGAIHTWQSVPGKAKYTQPASERDLPDGE